MRLRLRLRRRATPVGDGTRHGRQVGREEPFGAYSTGEFQVTWIIARGSAWSFVIVIIVVHLVLRVELVMLWFVLIVVNGTSWNRW